MKRLISIYDFSRKHLFGKSSIILTTCSVHHILGFDCDLNMYLPIPSHKQDVTQSHFFKFNRFEFKVFHQLDWLPYQV